MQNPTDEQIELILHNTKRFRDHLILRIAIDTGMRVGEIEALNVEDILDDGYKIRINKGKHHPEGRTIIIYSDPLIKMLKYYTKNRVGQEPLFISNKGGRLSKRIMQRIYTDVAAKIQLPKEQRHIHILRHSHVRRALGNVDGLPKYLGHSGWQGTIPYLP